ncbi:hypothetical protein DFH11DRAFT_1548144 [Phellopilus nigrolimitatus]|nr:hypothetical protein DFH11DRAFT_1548144 [Phellopilus nigrolimitatus]
MPHLNRRDCKAEGPRQGEDSNNFLRSDVHAKRAISLAKKGSADELLVLSSNIDIIPKQLVQDALSVLFKSLESRRPDSGATAVGIPHSRWLAHSENAEIAKSIMSGIQRIRPCFNKSSLQPIVERHWPALLAWLLLFYTELSNVYEDSGRLDKKQLSFIIDTFHTVAFCGDGVYASLKDPSAIELATKLWYLADSSSAFFASQILLWMLKQAGLCELTCRLLLKAAHYDHNAIAQLALRRLRRSLRQDSFDSRSAIAYVCVVLELASNEQSKFRQELLENRAITFSTKVMLLAMKSVSTSDFLPERVLLLFLEDLSKIVVDEATVLHYITEAVRAGLLEIILISIPYAAPTNPLIVMRLQDFIETIIPEHMKMHSFLGAVISSLQALPLDLLNTPAKLKRDCQVNDWRMKHRRICKQLQHQVQMGIYTESLSPRFHDREFIKRVASIDVRRHFSALLSTASSELPGLPKDLISFGVDYRHSIPRFTVRSLPEEYRRAKKCKEAWFSYIGGLVADVTETSLNRKSAFRGYNNSMLIVIDYFLLESSQKEVQTLSRAIFDDETNCLPPRLRPGALTGPKRPSGQYYEDDLEACYDEVDEAIRRLKEGTKLFSTSVWNRIDEVLNSMDKHNKNWPFEC